jgi:hypothetical protein
VPPDERYPVGELHKFNPAKLNDRLRKQFERNFPDTVVMGGWDFSLQFSSWDDRNPLWRPHWHLATDAPRDELKPTLNPFYPGDDFTKHPVVPKKLRLDFESLVTVPSYTAKVTVDRTNRGMTVTLADYFKKHELTPLQAADIYCLFDELGFSGRLFRRNAPAGLDFR